MISEESPSSKCTKTTPRFRREIRLTQSEYEELNLRATENSMTISEYMRYMIFKDKNIKINTDYDLYMAIKHLHNDINRLGNYLVHVTSVIEKAKSYKEKDELDKTILTLKGKTKETLDLILKVIKRK